MDAQVLVLEGRTYSLVASPPPNPLPSMVHFAARRGATVQTELLEAEPRTLMPEKDVMNAIVDVLGGGRGCCDDRQTAETTVRSIRVRKGSW